jgi:ribosome-associated translation inhibitor RaiA
MTLQITLRGFPPSDALTDRIHALAAGLDELGARATRCHVVVEQPHRHHRRRPFHVRVELSVPGGEIVATADPSQVHEHDDVYVALRDAFAAAERRLEDFEQRRRGRHHQARASG